MHYTYHIIYKPYMVLAQFTSTDGKLCLKDFFKVSKNVYPVGRLDFDSEGLLILTDDHTLNHRLLHPSFLHEREYLVQADGVIMPEALLQLQAGVTININAKAYRTKPCKTLLLNETPVVPDRDPPVRYRKHIPTSWAKLTLTEGKNRQVRKMMAAVGFPVLRLIRTRIEQVNLKEMQPGDMVTLSHNTMYSQLFGK